MNYLKTYNNIVEKASSRGLRKNKKKYGYTEIHHIKPRCMGGTDDKENLVQVTAREHFILHLLLTKIYPDELGLITAAFFMGCLSSSRYGYKVNSRIFEGLRKVYAIERSSISKETWQREGFKEKMSEIRSKIWQREGYREKREASIQKALKETDYREKLSKAAKEMWKRLEVREKVSKASKEMWENPEYKSMMSDMSREMWQRPGFKENMFESRSKMWKKEGYREKWHYSVSVSNLKNHFKHPLWDDYFILCEMHHQFKTFTQLYNFVKDEYPEFTSVDFRRLWKDFKKYGNNIPNGVFN